MIDNYSGIQKAAILLITLGPEKASSIFQHLKEEEIEGLTLEIANTRSVSPQDKEAVLEEFYQVCLAQQYIAEGGIGYAQELLEKAQGLENERNNKITAKQTECRKSFNSAVSELQQNASAKLKEAKDLNKNKVMEEKQKLQQSEFELKEQLKNTVVND